MAVHRMSPQSPQPKGVPAETAQLIVIEFDELVRILAGETIKLFEGSEIYLTAVDPFELAA